MWTPGRMASHASIFLLLVLLSVPLPSSGQTTQTPNSTLSNHSDAATPPTPISATLTATPTATNTTPTTTSPAATTSYGTSNSSQGAVGCGGGVEPMYRYLCDRRAVWGIVVESLASLGFVVSAGLLAGLLVWTLWAACASSRSSSRPGGAAASAALFLLAVAALFALTFAFVVRLTPRGTCPVRLFLFGVAFALAFACLLARCVALLGFAAARGRGEPCLALALFLVQAVIATEWLVVVLVRDGLQCEYSQGEFVMLLVYVLCLLAVALALALRSLCRACLTYSYSYTGNGGGGKRRSQVQAALLCVTLLLSAAIWVVWVALLTRGNYEMDRRPQWDDPVLSIALVANGWVLLLGHGLAQVVYLCQGESPAKDGPPLDFSGWASPGVELHKEGRENGCFENDARRMEPVLRSPYESGFSMTEIDPDKDYTIPRPQTTNIREPYDEYYCRTLSD